MAGSGWMHAETSGLLYVRGKCAIQEFLHCAFAFSSLIRANSLLFPSLRCFARTVQYCSHKNNKIITSTSSYDTITRLTGVSSRVVTCQPQVMMSVIMAIIRLRYVPKTSVEAIKATRCSLNRF